MPKKDRKKLPLQPLVPGPHIAGHSVAHCDISCIIILDNILLDFSPTHYRITLLLFQGMEEKREYVPFAQLIGCLERQYSNLRYSVYRHIHKIKPLLWPFGLDIVSMREMGYALVHTQLAASGR